MCVCVCAENTHAETLCGHLQEGSRMKKHTTQKTATQFHHQMFPQKPHRGRGCRTPGCESASSKPERDQMTALPPTLSLLAFSVALFAKPRAVFDWNLAHCAVAHDSASMSRTSVFPREGAQNRPQPFGLGGPCFSVTCLHGCAEDAAESTLRDDFLSLSAAMIESNPSLKNKASGKHSHLHITLHFSTPSSSSLAHLLDQPSVAHYPRRHQWLTARSG